MANDPGLRHIGDSCEPEDHAPCDVNVSVEYVRELIEAEGLRVPAFDRLYARGYQSLGEVVSALEAVQAAHPPTAAEVGAVIGYLREATGSGGV
jgi:hypothetical protein